MELLILNQKYETVSVVDIFESFIWTERYNRYGDFEIYAPASLLKIADGIKPDNYIYFKKSSRYMIIETVEIIADVENGDHISITGKSLEYILHRRVARYGWNMHGNFQNSIKTLLESNVIAPRDASEKIPNFTFVLSSDTAITSLKIDQQVRGENIYDILEANCIDEDIGFSVLPYLEGGFSFKLYAGKNRSFSQTDLPWIAFTPKIGNFVSGNFIESNADYSNVCHVYGEVERESTYTDDDGNSQSFTYTERIESIVTDGNDHVGLDRREIYYDAGRLEGSDDNGLAISSSILKNQLEKKGMEELLNKKKIYAFDGKVDPDLQYEYGKDYFLGDIVQVVDQYGHECESRITEVVYSYDDTGERIIPTFTKIEKEDN